MCKGVKYIKNQTKKICEAAVAKNGVALQFVPEEHKSEEICKL